MPTMQVTFNNVVPGARKGPEVGFQHFTLIFQIGFRGKNYDCVAHLRASIESAVFEHADRSSVTFAGYYGYDGPINIVKLREAAVDYYESTLKDKKSAPRLVNFDMREISGTPIAHQLQPARKQSEVCKSYEFNVGRLRRSAWQEASRPDLISG